MPIDSTTTFEVSTRGQVPESALEHGRDRLDRLSSHCREPISHVEFRVTEDPNHPGAQQATAEASLTTTRGTVRAHALGTTIHEAVDLMIERLKRRVDRHESRLHRVGSKRHDGVASPGSWRHGDVADAPRHARPVKRDTPPTIVRRKSFELRPMTIDDAAYELEILDHNFYLFQEAGSATTALLSRGEGGRYKLAIAEDAELEKLPVAYVDRMAGPDVLDADSAAELLTTSQQPFVFYTDSPLDAGRVLYRRYDGDLGMIELAPTEVS